MKSILLTSTALVAFAGAAAAESHSNISMALSGKLGYNDTQSNRAVGDDYDNEYGFYWEGNLKTTASVTLDNGITAGAYFEITIDEDNAVAGDDFGKALSSSDFVLSLTTDTASLYYGDTGTAADKHWSGVGDMESDDFTSGTNSAVLRGDLSVAGFETSISYLINDSAVSEATDNLEQLSFGASGSVGQFTLAAAYQDSSTYVDGDDDFDGDEVYAVSAGGTFAGASVTLGYASNETENTTSTGVKVAYPFGPVVVTGYYVMEEGTGGDEPNYGVNVAYSNGDIKVTADYQDDQGVPKWAIDGSYGLGNGLAVIAGVENQNEGADVDYYVGGTYDLGGGASILMTYAEDADGDQEDEIGSGDYQEGITVEVSFAF